ncbi:hypothetical protein IB229_07400 [Pseudomonas sp. PDM14]|uniref:hypothetical protein n=1 Tax=Pseudomonas sp. PDM14 TaxID=2769288 RepID=UPI00177DBE64|nr:hypothetical protein [Pseudomonas sp. PDM14]MBD9482788.1 hypothetical protein [Pseudomonas sp. PDM14]
MITLSFVLLNAANAADREIKVVEASNQNRAAACASAGKMLQNDISVQLGTRRLVDIGSCECSKSEDRSEYIKGDWTCTAKGTYE